MREDSVAKCTSRLLREPQIAYFTAWPSSHPAPPVSAPFSTSSEGVKIHGTVFIGD